MVVTPVYKPKYEITALGLDVFKNLISDDMEPCEGEMGWKSPQVNKMTHKKETPLFLTK